MIDFTEYEEALAYIKRYIEQDLKDLDIVAAQIFGSSTYGEGFIKGISDIDICVFSNKMLMIPYPRIVEYIVKQTNANFLDKKPSIVVDYIADRIEFYIAHPQIALDITIMAPELPKCNHMSETATHDAVDILVGAFYQYGIPLIGEIPQKQFVEENFFPFYKDELRKKRLDTLVPRIKKYHKRLEILIQQENGDILDHLYKARIYFLKWLFIYKRKYPVNLQKHLDYQLSHILELPLKEKEAILFIGEHHNIFQAASAYLQVVNTYMDVYESV